jgi:hypothetical protein
MGSRLRFALALALVVRASAASAGKEEAALSAMRNACENAEPTCDPVQLLSGLERTAVDRAMAPRGLAFDHAPYGKQIGHIYIVDHTVFGPGDGPLRLLNVFHISTKASTVRRELVFHEGQTWDQARIDETARHLRDPISTSLVAIVPIASGTDGVVDVLVVTRDVWSLRANSNYEIQGNQLTFLSLALSENNFLGWRKLVAASFRMDQGAYRVGPLYLDRNAFGKHIYVLALGGPVFNRHTSKLEGSASEVTVARPLWSLDTKWGAQLDWTHRDAIDRAFQGDGLALFHAPDGEELPYEYHMKKYTLKATVTRGFGDKVEQRVKGGYALSIIRPTLLPDFQADTRVARDSFVNGAMPPSERTSELFVGWSMFVPKFRNFQNVDTFDLAEDVQMGPQSEAELGLALGLYGSEANFLRLTGSLGYTGGLGDDGLWKLTMSATSRVQGGEAIDNILETQARFVSPTFGFMRLVSQLTLSGLFIDRQNQYYTLGGDNGLRGYPIGAERGDRRMVWQTEIRSKPISILFTRDGFVWFVDVGDSANSFRGMALHTDVGVGLRALVPQLDSGVYRFDIAVPVDDAGKRDRFGRARFTAGYEQSF